MALRIDPAIEAKYVRFYDFALREKPMIGADVAVLTQAVPTLAQHAPDSTLDAPLDSTLSGVSSAVCDALPAACDAPSAVCDELSAVCVAPSAVCDAPSAVCDAPSAVCDELSAVCDAPPAASSDVTPQPATDTTSPTASPTTAASNPSVLLLEHLDDNAFCDAIAALQTSAAALVHCVMVRDCPQLHSLAALATLPNVTSVGVWRCKAVQELWDTARQPLAALCLADCKALRTLAPLAGCADTLRHLFLQGRGWSLPRLASLAPLPRLHALVTCDLAAKKVDGGEIIYFEEQFPQLETLTITPNLAKYFRRVRE